MLTFYGFLFFGFMVLGVCFYGFIVLMVYSFSFLWFIGFDIYQISIPCFQEDIGPISKVVEIY